MTYFDEEETIFSLILTFCVLLGIGVGILISYENPDWLNKKLEQCEAELPRNQKCILVAVPESKS